MDDRCTVLVAGGLVYGAIGGGIGGFVLLGPAGAVGGVFIGGGAGAVIAIVACALLIRLFGKQASRPSISFAPPRLTGTLSAPGTVRVGQPCQINFSFQVTNNTDNALCEITGHITAVGGTPSDSPPFSFSSNGSSFGTALPVFTTQFGAQSDGQPIIGTLHLTATYGGQTYVDDLTPPAKRSVVVVP